MIVNPKRVIRYVSLLVVFLQLVAIPLFAQKETLSSSKELTTEELWKIDSLAQEQVSKIKLPDQEAPLVADSLPIPVPVLATPPELKKKWIPNSLKATWLATVFPGGGQIYNRKYWKLPIIYGGFLGCAYGLSWNNQYYKDYSQAYLDIMSNDPSKNSYLDFLPNGYDVQGNKEWLKTVFRKKKDTYRRYRDLSIFAFIGVYLVSIIDAYVDAELSDFDISPDLSFRIEPTVISSRARNEGYGLQFSFNF